MGIFTEESNAFAPLAMLKSLGDIPFDTRSNAPVSPNDMFREAMNLPPLNIVKALGNIPINGQSNAPVSPNDMLQALSQMMELKPTKDRPTPGTPMSEILQGIGNYLGDVKDFYEGPTSSDIAYNPQAVGASGHTPTEEELDAQKATSEKDALQKSYDQITKYESVIGEMPPKLQAMARPMIAQWLREDGAPSDLVSIYSKYGGSAPDEHMKFQALMGKGAENGMAKFEREYLQSLVTNARDEHKATLASLMKMPAKELMVQPDVPKGKPLASTSMWPKFLGGAPDSRNIQNILNYANEISPLTDLKQIFAQQAQTKTQQYRDAATVQALKVGTKTLGMGK